MEASVRAWGVGEERMPERAPGRECKECGCGLSSYDPWRERCSSCALSRSRAEVALAVACCRAEEALSGVTNSRKRSRIQRKIVALALAMLSSPVRWGYRDTMERLAASLPIRPEKVRVHVARLVEDGLVEYVEEIDAYFVVGLPETRFLDGLYPSVLANGEAPLRPQTLWDLYLAEQAPPPKKPGPTYSGPDRRRAWALYPFFLLANSPWPDLASRLF